jgi:hypothetical protein
VQYEIPRHTYPLNAPLRSLHRSSEAGLSSTSLYGAVMHDPAMAAYLITAIGLFAAPLVAFGAFAAIQSRWTSRQPTIAAVCASVLVFVLGAAALGFSFKDPLPNFVAFMIAYAAYCLLAVFCWRIPSLFIRIPALLLAGDSDMGPQVGASCADALARYNQQ